MCHRRHQGRSRAHEWGLRTSGVPCGSSIPRAADLPIRGRRIARGAADLRADPSLDAFSGKDALGGRLPGRRRRAASRRGAHPGIRRRNGPATRRGAPRRLLDLASLYRAVQGIAFDAIVVRGGLRTLLARPVRHAAAARCAARRRPFCCPRHANRIGSRCRSSVRRRHDQPAARRSGVIGERRASALTCKRNAPRRRSRK